MVLTSQLSEPPTSINSSQARSPPLQSPGSCHSDPFCSVGAGSGHGERLVIASEEPKVSPGRAVLVEGDAALGPLCPMSPTSVMGMAGAIASFSGWTDMVFWKM